MNTRPDFDAVLFDLDGVLTATSRLHAACWKQTFDEVLAERSEAPFDVERDYIAHVDGKPREDGVRDFLAARRIDVTESVVRSIGERKQALVEQALRSGGVEAFPGSVRWVRELRDAGVQTAVVSSSRNSRAVLRSAGIDAAVRRGRRRSRRRAARLARQAGAGRVPRGRRASRRAARRAPSSSRTPSPASPRAGPAGSVSCSAWRAAPRPRICSPAGADIVVDDLAEMAR